MAKRIITEKDIIEASQRGDDTLRFPMGECIVTAQAQDKALELGLSLVQGCAAGEPLPAGSEQRPPEERVESSELGDLVLQVVEKMQGMLPPDVDNSQVVRLVRDAVAARMAACRDGGTRAVSGVIFIDHARLLGKTGATSAIKERTVLAEAIGRPGESKLAAGYLAWEGMTFERAVGAPEILVVIEGELHLQFDGRNVVARPGDMVYLPEGTNVSLDAPARVKLACINGLA